MHENAKQYQSMMKGHKINAGGMVKTMKTGNRNDRAKTTKVVKKSYSKSAKY